MSRLTLPRPPHPAPASRDDRETPLCGTGWGWRYSGDLGQTRRGIFYGRDWTASIRLIRSEITLNAQGELILHWTCRGMLGANDPLRNSILNLMAEDDPIDEISRIEARLEELAEVAERCRKIILVFEGGDRHRRRIAAPRDTRPVRVNQVAAIGSIAAALGGIVSLGSNVGTLRQTMAAMSAAEVLRSDLIDRIDLRVVGDRTA